MESIADYAIYMLDTSGRVTTWNLGAEKIKGYTADEIIGQHFSTFYPKEDIDARKPQRELEIAAEVGRVEDEGWRLRKDGSRFWANVVITALRDEAGRLRGFGKVTRDLTVRKQAEDALLSAEQRFHDLVDAVTDYAIFSLDATGHVATWNPGAERTKGWTAREIIGRHFSVFYTAEDSANGKPERILETVRREGRFEDEMWRVRKDGTRFWANVVITAIRNERGEVVSFAKVTRDLTARRKAEETARELRAEQAAREASEKSERALRDSEERYRALSRRLEGILEGVADGIMVQDRAGRLIFANSAAARLCRVGSVAELLATPVDELAARFEILDERGERLPPEMMPSARVLAGERTVTAVVRLRLEDASEAWWVSVRASPVHSTSGEAELAIIVWHDVTDERRAEADARHIGDATAAMARALGRDATIAALCAAVAPGLADRCTVTLDDPAPPTAAAIVDDGRGVVAPIHVGNAARGTLRMSSAAQRYDEHDLGLVAEIGRRAGVALEKAFLYEASEAAKRSAEEAARNAEQANRIKDEFLATASHELRTPLNAIVGWAAILRQQSLEPSVARALEVIDRNAQAQVKLVDDILDVSRIITGKLRLELRATDLCVLTHEAIEVVRPSAAAKEIEITIQSPTPSCVLAGDPERLRQVVWNLLSNAVKFTDARGRIAIEIRKEGSALVLEVADSGQGISPDFLPYVFDRFKQADASTTRRYGGLGLGLSLVRHIVELHGGSVHAESEGKGKGAKFRIHLPLRAVLPVARPERPEPHAPISSPHARPEPLHGLRILVIDDDPDARDLLVAVLEASGGTARVAKSASEGFGMVGLFRPHVIVSDIGMPDEDGYSFARRLRTLDPHEGGLTPSIALTAYTRQEDRGKALAAGFTAHLGKPVNPDELVATVANLAPFARR